MKAAQIIWKQISVATKMACGARNAKVADKEGRTLQFQVESKPMRFIEVVYDLGADLYNVRYFRVKRSDYSQINMGEAMGVYAESLSEVIYRMVNK